MSVNELDENFDSAKTCRLCLNQNNKLISIFVMSSFELQYSIIINECTSVKITEYDKLPKSICIECVECLNKFFQFRNTVTNSQRLLNDFWNNLKKNAKVENTNSIKEEMPSSEEPTCRSIKSEGDPLLLEADPKIEDKSQNLFLLKVNEPIIVPFAFKTVETNKNSIKEEIDSNEEPTCSIKSEEDPLLLDEDPPELNDYGKIDRDTSSSHVTRHKNSSKKCEKVYNCNECGKAFNKKQTLQRHELIHSGEKPYSCKQCGKCFNRLGGLKRHENIHTGEKPFFCKQCNKAFRVKEYLKDHERIHTGLKPHICKECNKAFNRKELLRNHERIHTGEKPYNCKHCGKSFTQSWNLTNHERMHRGEKLYNCKQCGKSFITSTDLKRHKRSHTGERPFKCKQCGKCFSRSCSLRTHEKLHKAKRN